MDERKSLFIQFLKDKRTYNLNVGYWRRKLQKALEEKISRQDQFIKNKNSKGKSFYDGNPIFSYYNSSKEKAIRIIQEDPGELNNYLEIKLVEAWIDNIRIPNLKDKEVEVPELVISIYLTSSSVDKCLFLVRSWYFGQLNKSNIEELINE